MSEVKREKSLQKLRETLNDASIYLKENKSLKKALEELSPPEESAGWFLSEKIGQVIPCGVYTFNEEGRFRRRDESERGGCGLYTSRDEIQMDGLCLACYTKSMRDEQLDSESFAKLVDELG